MSLSYGEFARLANMAGLDASKSGPPGNGVSSVVVAYQQGSSGSTAPTGTWVSTPPVVTKGQYLWTRTVTTYTDTTTSTAYVVTYQPNDGPTGVGISGTAITYQQGSSGTTAPTGTWVAAPPAATQGKFLWTRTVTTYTDSSTSTAYSAAYQGADSTVAGPAPAITAVANQLAAGSAPTAVVSGTSPNLTLTLGLPVMNSNMTHYSDGLQLIQQTSLGSVSKSFVIAANTVKSQNARVMIDGLFTADAGSTTKTGTFAINSQNVVNFSTSGSSRGNPFRQSGMNRNALNSQVWVPLTANGGAGTNAQVGVTATTIDWTVDNTCTITLTLSGTLNGTPSITLEWFDFIVIN